MKLAKYILFVLLLVLFSLNVNAMFYPQTLAGQRAGCSVYPAETFDFPDGGKISLEQKDGMFDVYRIGPDGEYIFIDEYAKKVDLDLPTHHYVVEVYDGCDFSDFDWWFDNGRPNPSFLWLGGEDCPAGYIDDGAGNCVPTDKQRLLNLKEYCVNQGKYWYDFECHDKPKLYAQMIQETGDFFRSGDIGFYFNAIFIIVISLFGLKFVLTPEVRNVILDKLEKFYILLLAIGIFLFIPDPLDALAGIGMIIEAIAGILGLLGLARSRKLI